MPLAKLINDLVPFGNIIVTALMSALALQLILSSLVWLPYRPVCGSVLLFKGILLTCAFFLVGRKQFDGIEASFGGAAPRSVAPIDAAVNATKNMMNATAATS